MSLSAEALQASLQKSGLIKPKNISLTFAVNSLAEPLCENREELELQ